MNETETGRFLAMVIALDPKMPQPDGQGFMRKLWARQLAEVPFDAADRAMQAYYSSERYLEKRETISPADVVQWWNARRRPNDRERAGTAAPRALPRATFDPRRLRDGVDRVLAAMARGKAERAGTNQADATDEADGEVAYRRMVLAVDCPHCRAPAGRPCVRIGRSVDTQVPLRRYHPSRVDRSQSRTPAATAPESRP